MARILNISYLRRSYMPGLTRRIAEGSLYRYLEEELGEYNCLAVVANQVYNSEGVMFEYTQSRHYPGSFRFQDNAVRRPAES